MNLGEPVKVVEVELDESDAPQPIRENDVPESVPSEVPVETPELVPAGFFPEAKRSYDWKIANHAKNYGKIAWSNEGNDWDY